MPSANDFDGITELGLIFKEEIPVGADFEPWLLDKIGMGTFVAAMEGEGWQLEELPLLIAWISHGRWGPPVEMIRQLAEAS